MKKLSDAEFELIIRKLEQTLVQASTRGDLETLEYVSNRLDELIKKMEHKHPALKLEGFTN